MYKKIGSKVVVSVKEASVVIMEDFKQEKSNHRETGELIATGCFGYHNVTWLREGVGGCVCVKKRERKKEQD